MTSEFDHQKTESNSFADLFEALQPINVAAVILAAMQQTAAFRDRGYVSDSYIIQNCISQERLRRIPECRVSRAYLASFVLRHAAVWVALCCERLNQKNPCLSLKYKDKSPFSLLEQQTEGFFLNSQGRFSGLHLSLTARGIEWLRKPLWVCGQFDAYASEEDIGCTSPSLHDGGYCEQHTKHRWFQNVSEEHGDFLKQKSSQETNASLGELIGVRAQVTARHDTMMEFYANFSNLLAYTQAELDEMVRQYFRRIKQHLVLETICTEWAVQEFDFAHFDELRSAGSQELRKRYRRKALEIHPDLGGDTEAFQKMQKAYGLLMSLLGP